MEINNKNTIMHNKLKEARLARGMTIQELADRINVTKQAVSQFESGIIVPKA
jgi:transcriptional regulator with XRE-family HTH domain